MGSVMVPRGRVTGSTYLLIVSYVNLNLNLNLRVLETTSAGVAMLASEKTQGFLFDLLSRSAAAAAAAAS